jgi:transposase
MVFRHIDADGIVLHPFHASACRSGLSPGNRVVFEPTEPYHRAVERALGASDVPFVKVNPRQARRFAEATGKLAKTDRWMRRCWLVCAHC